MTGAVQLRSCLVSPTLLGKARYLLLFLYGSVLVPTMVSACSNRSRLTRVVLLVGSLALAPHGRRRHYRRSIGPSAMSTKGPVDQ
jgi:hypothetical protein